MAHIALVAIVDSPQHLLNYDSGIPLIKPASSRDFIEQLTSLHQVLHDVDPILIFIVLVNFDYVRVVQPLENFNFLACFIALLLGHSALVLNFDRSLLLRQFVRAN